MTLAWVIPPWRVGSGGHAAIFQLIHELEKRGHSCAVYVFDPFHYEPRPASELKAEIAERFVPLDAEVFVGLEDFDSADVAVATSWWTAYPVRDLPNCREKVYLVQDHETEFYPTSVEAIWAEQTYKMGYRCLAYTPWIAGVLRSRYGLEVAQFDCGADLDTYTVDGPESREPGLIAVYARGETSRRGVELAIGGLATLFERRADQRVVLFGSNFPPTVPFPAENVGVVPPAELASLYRTASVGVVFSLTNLSLVDQEMMACGLPVVELDVENVSTSLGPSGEVAVLARPTPSGVADAIASVLDSSETAAAMADRARGFVAGRTWAHAAEQVEAALLGYLATPRTGSQPSRRDAGGWHLRARALQAGSFRSERGGVTELLAERLGEEVLADIERRVGSDLTSVVVHEPGSLEPRPTTVGDVWRRATDDLERKRIALALGVHYGNDTLLERTGLTAEMPPPDIHQLGGGPIAAGGSIYHADLVVDGLSSAGVEPAAGMRILDFGSSSGRVVRVLAAAYPEVDWHACDPNGPAMEWAEENIRGVTFTKTGTRPPLPFADASFNAVYAISIWSHFAEDAALAWFDEMQRIIRPGGHLLLTTHGLHTAAFYDREGVYPEQRLKEIMDALYRSGYWFDPVFGDEGDAGVVDRAWGLSFLTPEWLLSRVCPQWRVAEYAAGRNEGSQDVFVLERAAGVSDEEVASLPEAAASHARRATTRSS